MQETNEKISKKSPIESFFELGNKATKGDPIRKAKFDYYLLWIMFLAFFSILISNFLGFLELVKVNFISSLKPLGWTGVMAAIMWFQYFGLKSAYDVNKAMKKMKTGLDISDELKVESKDDMLKDFEVEDACKEVKKDGDKQ
jgi:hypothetical protein